MRWTWAVLALGASVAVVEAVPKDWCQYICPNNEMVPEVHNEEYIPEDHVNGCGTELLDMSEVGEKYNLTTCCNMHDVCYATCGKKFDECENAFKTCLDRQCAVSFKNETSEERKECDSQANLFSTGTRLFGCSSFRSSQEVACVCDEELGTFHKPSRKPKKPKKLAERQREDDERLQATNDLLSGPLKDLLSLDKDDGPRVDENGKRIDAEYDLTGTSEGGAPRAKGTEQGGSELLDGIGPSEMEALFASVFEALAPSDDNEDDDGDEKDEDGEEKEEDGEEKDEEKEEAKREAKPWSGAKPSAKDDAEFEALLNSLGEEGGLFDEGAKASTKSQPAAVAEDADEVLEASGDDSPSARKRSSSGAAVRKPESAVAPEEEDDEILRGRTRRARRSAEADQEDSTGSSSSSSSSSSSAKKAKKAKASKKAKKAAAEEEAARRKRDEPIFDVDPAPAKAIWEDTLKDMMGELGDLFKISEGDPEPFLKFFEDNPNDPERNSPEAEAETERLTQMALDRLEKDKAAKSKLEKEKEKEKEGKGGKTGEKAKKGAKKETETKTVVDEADVDEFARAERVLQEAEEEARRRESGGMDAKKRAARKTTEKVEKVEKAEKAEKVEKAEKEAETKSKEEGARKIKKPKLKREPKMTAEEL